MGWIDYGKDDDLLWIVFLQKNGECWIYPNPEIRACPNVTAGRLSGISSKQLSQSINVRRPRLVQRLKKSSSSPGLNSSARHSQNGHS